MSQSPKIGLALGSGSARGWAHIGVLQVLQEAKLDIHCIAGCSIGSLIGAIYAVGALSPFTEWVESLTRRNFTKFIDISFSGGGMMSGDKLMQFLQKFNLNQSIESLPLRFGSVATDLHSGREVWLTEGDLTPAIRSSISLPGLFQPVAYQDVWLVDGGMVNPVPVSLCRALGADVVIAVNLNHDLMKFQGEMSAVSNPGGIKSSLEKMIKKIIGWQERPGYYDVLTQSIKIMQDKITKARLSGDPADVNIEPWLSNFSLYDFDKAREGIHEGREAAKRQMPLIKKILNFSSE